MRVIVTIVLVLGVGAPVRESLFVAGEGDFAVQHSSRGHEFVAQMTHFFRLAAQDRHFQAMPLAEVNVQRRNDEVVMMVLLVDQFRGQLSSVMVVNQHDDRDNLAGRVGGLFVDEPFANEVAQGLPTGRLAYPLPSICLSNATSSDSSSEMLTRVSSAMMSSGI